MQKALLCLLLLIGISTPLLATDKGWIEVRSPHFRVLTNHSEKEARDVALGMEQIRAIFAESLPGLRVDSDVETVVFAARDVQTMRQLLPESLLSKSGYVGGVYISGSDRDYALLRLDTWQPQTTIYHEYVHKLLHLNFTRLPRRLDEGLAEFFANSGTRDGKTILGLSSPRLEGLRQSGIEPVEKIIYYDYASESTWDPYKLQNFYAESWALTHYLMLKDGVQSVSKVNSYLKALQKGGAKPNEAFTSNFGEPKEITKSLRDYINQKMLPALIIPPITKIDPSTFAATKLSGAQMSAELAWYYMRQHRFPEARKKAQDAVDEESNNWVAHEALAFVNHYQGKSEEALREWDAAIAQNPKAALSIYYRNVMALWRKKDPESVGKLKDAMDRVLAIDSEMVPARVLRSRLFAMQGDSESALAESKRILKLEPDFIGNFLNYAEMELLRKNYQVAIQTSRWAANRWTTHSTYDAEALDLADRARRMGSIAATDDEKAEAARLMEWAKDTTPTSGTLESVTCNRPNWTIVVRSGEKKYTFNGEVRYARSKTFPIASEYFDPCFHALDLRLVVWSKQPPKENLTNEMVRIGFRDDLLPGEIE